MKLVTLLPRPFPPGRLDCCLPAAASPAPGGSQRGFRKCFVSRFSQANITRSKQPSDQPAGRCPTSWTVPVNSSNTVMLIEHSNKLSLPRAVSGCLYGQSQRPADDRTLKSTLADHPKPWFFPQQCQPVFWNIQRKELRS